MYERNDFILYVAEMGFHKTILRYIVILFKGLLHPKMRMLSLITYPMSFQTRKSFVCLQEHNLRYFGWKPVGLWLSHWLPNNQHYQGPEKYEIYRRNSPSTLSVSSVILQSYKNTFECKENKKYLFFKLYPLDANSLRCSVSATPHGYAFHFRVE